MITISFKEDIRLEKQTFESLEEFLFYLAKVGKLTDLEDYLLVKHIKESEKLNEFVSEEEVFKKLDDVIWN